MEKTSSPPRRHFDRAAAIFFILASLATARPQLTAHQATQPTTHPTTQPTNDWQLVVHNCVTNHHLDAALAVVEHRLADAPDDLEAHGWRGRLLSWKGRWPEGEAEYRLVLEKVPNDTEILAGLADVLLWQKKYSESLQILDRARKVAPADSEILARRARVLALLHANARHELRIGNDTDFFDYTGAAQTQSASLSSRWNQRWSTVFATNIYQRFGEGAVKFLASAAFHFTDRDWLNAGGSVANQQAVVPTTEAFFEYGRGFHFENGWMRSLGVSGLESSYQQHWYWYQGAHVLTLSISNLVYLPRGWTWGLTVTGARTGFVGTSSDWIPSGWTKLGFPLQRRLAGNLLYAVGSEDFSQVDQIGRFSAHTYGGGLRYQLAEKQDITGAVSRQYRSRGQTETSFGLSYGIRF